MKREQPFLNSHFTVEIGGMPAVGREGFCAVLLPGLLTPAAAERERGDAVQPTLTLRRGYAGSPDLHRWWDKARQGRAPKQRTVSVALLDEAHARMVLRWRFFDTVPLMLAYSALDAMNPAVLIETLELGFSHARIG